ncbi:MAG: dTDP-4-dehydrorhamnose 3,5-epimerase family protein, partial [Acidobacteriota bacterium]
MIDGVKIKKLRVIPDERGRLMEILRNDDDLFEKFGQVYMSTTYPGVVKAWHLHHHQTDNVCCVHGMIKLALYDAREDSPTYKQVDQ